VSDLNVLHDRYKKAVAGMRAANGKLTALFALSTGVRGVGNRALDLHYYYLRRLTVMTEQHTAVIVSWADQMREELNALRKEASDG
jgi:hypothetical protein